MKKSGENTLFPRDILTGIETEFGIIRKDQENSDPVVESMELIKAYRSHSFGSWAYETEDPRSDARGFRAERLAQDDEEEAFTRSDLRRPFSFRESKSDRILQNGARFYNDHTHPEYSTPECCSLSDIVLYDRAGTEIVRNAVRAREEEIGQSGTLGIYRNNSDFHGHSYGCHENYLLPRSLSFERIVSGLTTFLVARTLFLGGGKVGQEGVDGFSNYSYQLSQRADFIEERVGVDTMHRRPIVNSRDEPHADRTRYRRLHLICGDANMSEWQTAMKIGMTRLVLAAIGSFPHWNPPALLDPVQSFRQVSRAENGHVLLMLSSGQSIYPVDLLSAYLDNVCQVATDEEDRWVIEEWNRALSDFKEDPSRLTDRVDWVIKKQLLDLFCEEEGIESGDPWLKSLDLAYHDLDPELGMFWPLEEEGRVRRLTLPPKVDQATIAPPSLGRAPVRSAIIQRFEGIIRDAGWEHISFSDGMSLDLPLFMDLDREAIETLCRKIKTCPGKENLVELLTF